MKTISLTDDQLHTLVDALDNWAEAIEHLKDEEYNQELEALAELLRKHLPEFTDGRIKERKIRALWGDRCPDYEPDCVVCQAWTHYDQTGEVI